MKGRLLMNIYFRILLGIYAFCLTIISLLIMITTFRPDFFLSISSFVVDNLLINRNLSIILFCVAFVFFISSLTFLFSGTNTKKNKKAVSKFTNYGEIKISLESIENIAFITTKKFASVRESKVYVDNINDNVRYRLFPL